jgi:hypothetical protein
MRKPSLFLDQAFFVGYVPMLELVAAWEPSFFHQVGAKLGKRNGQFTEKLAMKF